MRKSIGEVRLHWGSRESAGDLFRSCQIQYNLHKIGRPIMSIEGTRRGEMAGRLGGISEAFADRNFRIYSIGSILSWLSFFVQMVAMSWTTWELTHSTAWLAIIAVLDIAPNLILLPLGGVLADRFDRFRMVLIAYAAAWFHVLALTILAYTGSLTILPLAVLSFLHGVIHSFSVPAAY